MTTPDLSAAADGSASTSLFAAVLAGAAPTLRRAPPSEAVRRHTTVDEAPPTATAPKKPKRITPRQILATVPKVISAQEACGADPSSKSASEAGPPPTDDARTDDGEGVPEVPWADDQAPSGLPTLGDKLAGGEVAVTLPILMRSRMLITASSGAGKSYAVRRLIEQTAPMVQQLIIDPEGEFETLAERFPFAIFNDRDKERPLSKYSPFVLAQQLVKSGVSAVLDLSDFDYEGESKHHFVARFIKGLMALDQEHWRHVMVVIDEAHLFAPQQDKSEAKKAVIELASRGRKRGLCPVLATQRFSMLNKSVAAELQNRMIGLTILDRDLRRAADELGMTMRDATAVLTSFEPGHFFVYGPALTRTVQRMKVGPVVTTHGVNLGDLKPPSAPTAEMMDEIFALAEIKDQRPAVGSTSQVPAGASQPIDHEGLRLQIAQQRVALLMPVLQAQDADAKAAAMKAAAQGGGVSPWAIYQWLSKYDPANPVASLMPERLSKAAVASLSRPSSPMVTTAPPPAGSNPPSPVKRKTTVAKARTTGARAKKAAPVKTGKRAAVTKPAKQAKSKPPTRTTQRAAKKGAPKHKTPAPTGKHRRASAWLSSVAER